MNQTRYWVLFPACLASMFAGSSIAHNFWLKPNLALPPLDTEAIKQDVDRVIAQERRERAEKTADQETPS